MERQTSRTRPPPITRTTSADSRRVARARPKDEGDGGGSKSPAIVKHLRPRRPENDAAPRPPKAPRQEKPTPHLREARSGHDERLLIPDEKAPVPDGSIYTKEKHEALQRYHLSLALYKSGMSTQEPKRPEIIQGLSEADQEGIRVQHKVLRKEAKKSRKQEKKAARSTASGTDRKKLLLRKLTLPSKLPSLPKLGRAGLSASGGGYEKLAGDPPEKPQDPAPASSSTSSRSATDAAEKSG